MEHLIVWILGGGLVGLVGLVLNNNREQDKKIGRSYERLDETKAYQDDTFVRKDICFERHVQITNDLNEIKQDVKFLVNNGGCYREKNARSDRTD